LEENIKRESPGQIAFALFYGKFLIQFEIIKLESSAYKKIYDDVLSRGEMFT